MQPAFLKRCGALALALTLASVAPANNDCCYDWNPTPGLGDIPTGAALLAGGPARPGAPNGWSHCTGAAQNGSGKTNCLARKGRQGWMGNSICVIGSPDPNGVPPISNPPWGAGFRCDPKADGPGVWLQFIDMVTEPIGAINNIEFEAPAGAIGASVPTLGGWGRGVLAVLFGLAGIWMIRRQGRSALGLRP